MSKFITNSEKYYCILTLKIIVFENWFYNRDCVNIESVIYFCLCQTINLFLLLSMMLAVLSLPIWIVGGVMLDYSLYHPIVVSIIANNYVECLYIKF